jgi:hypothetical protein
MSFYKYFFGGNVSVGNFGGSGSAAMGDERVVRINGREFRGSNVEWNNGVIIIDGKPVSLDDEGSTKYTVASITIEGNVTGGVRSTSADVTVTGNVAGPVSTTSGDVQIDQDIKGDVSTTSGDVSAHTITGSVKTVSGDVDKSFKRRK